MPEQHTMSYSVSVDFGKGQDNLAAEVSDDLTRRYGLDTKTKTFVHQLAVHRVNERERERERDCTI